MNTIQALVIQTGQIQTFAVERFHQDGVMAYAVLAGTSRYAEMNLTRPQDGWKIFPD